MTWDDDDPERHQVTRRALTKKEIEENDFRAYIANTSSESEDDKSSLKKKKKDKKASRDKLRSLLLGGNEEAIPEGWGEDGVDDDVDMEITFTPGLSGKKNEEDETTLEKYQRKMKEKRKKRKEEVKEKEAPKEKGVDDEFFEASEDESAPVEKESKGKPKKGKKNQQTEDNDASLTRKEATAEELALLVASDNPNAEPKHFNIKSVIKAEKQKKRKKGKRGKLDNDNEAQEDFVMNVKDDRFQVLFEDHQFAIDPTNPQYVFYFVL